jgi:hypothetical protein
VPWKPDSCISWSRNGGKTVDERTSESQRLTDCLKLYFPQVLQWFDDVASPLVGDLLERWPTLEQLQRAHPGTLRKFFQQNAWSWVAEIACWIAAMRSAFVSWLRHLLEGPGGCYWTKRASCRLVMTPG